VCSSDLGAELQTVVNLMQARAAEHGTELELTIDPGLPGWIRGDPTRFRQVALNLVSNAVKFTRGGLVSCRLYAVERDLLLEVIDSGIGMSRETMERLFKPFSQADASTTRRFGGSGLGLAIAGRLVRAMGGTVSVDSEVGVGSCFEVRVPFVVAPAPEQRPAARDVATSLDVLVAEDNPVNQLVARRILEQLGHHVVLVPDGQAAIDACGERPFDLVLMDCHMPVLDGFEATRRLRARGVTLPIIALTAAVSTEDRARCTECGMNDLLAKPLRVERLKAVLSTVSPRARAAA
jgi:CheY-like chemotaxis protein